MAHSMQHLKNFILSFYQNGKQKCQKINCVIMESKENNYKIISQQLSTYVKTMK